MTTTDPFTEAARAEAAIRRGEKLDPRTIHDIATGRKA